MPTRIWLRSHLWEEQRAEMDYAQYGLFHHFTCNFSVDENGFNHVDALEGQIGFTKYGKVQVGEVTMSAWFGIEDTTEQSYIIILTARQS